MNLDLLYNGLIQMGISILVGIIILYTVYKMVDKYIQKKYEMGNDNIAYAILCSSILFSVGYLFNGLNQVISNSIELMFHEHCICGAFFVLNNSKNLNYFQRLLLHSFCLSLVRKVQATIRVTLFPVPMGMVFTSNAPT